jgi:hypothetical protein
METWRAVLLAPAVIVLALFGGLLAGQAAMGQRTLIAVPFLVLIPVVYWKWPHVAPLSLLAAALVIEEWTYFIGTRKGPFTDRLPLFRTPTRGVIILPIEAIITIALVIWILKSAERRSITLPRSPVARALSLFWGIIVLGLGVGLAHGGKFNFALWEIRPWLLLTCAYVLTTAWVTTRQLMRAILWVLVLGTGFKAIQGSIIFFTYSRHLDPRPDAILAHEESLFFGIFILLTLALWLYGQRGRLRLVATILLPAVGIADLANSRRTASGILIVGALVLLVSAWVGLPERRRIVGAIFSVVAISGAVYLPVYWNQGYGTISQPARAVRSQVSPDPRDASSDTYRSEEDANLILNAKTAGLLGKGYGRPIDYILPIADISNIDPTIAYIPHNGLLWIWMRLGVQGEIAFWLLIGFAIITAGRVARAQDRFIAMFGALVICALFGYVLQGYEDLGFASLRIAPVIGCLLGGLEAALRLMRSDRGPAPTALGATWAKSLGVTHGGGSRIHIADGRA